MLLFWIRSSDILIPAALESQITDEKRRTDQGPGNAEFLLLSALQRAASDIEIVS